MTTLATVHPIRGALRNWPTGVAVLTTADRDGWWWGCTVNSVALVSTHPPIVSVSIPRDAPGQQVLTTAPAFAIHVLRADQEPLATHFAATPENFDNIDVECGFASVPLLREASTRLECRPVNTIPAGANTLLLGEVHQAHTTPGDPLIHLNTHYRKLAHPS
jgi:flavin reductase (DIM6/NTAB) family NADH-FMN oxidoreductase RutF